MEKLKDYFSQKSGLDDLESDKKKEQDRRQLLFPTLIYPTVNQIGSVVQLDGGHTKEFSWKEEVKMNEHLMSAGFGDQETSNYLQEVALDESMINVK